MDNEPDWLKERREEAKKQQLKHTIRPFKEQLSTSILFNYEGLKNPIKQSMITFTPSIVLEEPIENRVFTGVVPDSLFEAFHEANANIFTIRITPTSHSPIIISRESFGTGADHIVIIVEKGSKCQIIDMHTSKHSQTQNLRSDGTEFFLDDGSEIDYYTIQEYDEFTLAVETSRIHLGEYSRFSWNGCSLGSNGHFLTTFADGKEGSSFKQQLVSLKKSDQQIFSKLTAELKGKNSIANIKVKGVATEKSKTIISCGIHIHKDALDATGIQDIDLVILDEGCIADAIPMLEIDNPFVTCRHAARVGHFDKDVLFYLQSRGLSQEQAKKMIINGFFSSFITEIDNHEIKEKLNNALC